MKDRYCLIWPSGSWVLHSLACHASISFLLHCVCDVLLCTWLASLRWRQGNIGGNGGDGCPQVASGLHLPSLGSLWRDSLVSFYSNWNCREGSWLADLDQAHCGGLSALARRQLLMPLHQTHLRWVEGKGADLQRRGLPWERWAGGDPEHIKQNQATALIC